MEIVNIRKNLFYLLLRLTLLMMTISFFIGCAEVPITQRESLRLVPESELMSMSFKEYQQVLDKSTLSTDQNKVQTVRKVGSRIAKAAEAFLADLGRENQVRNYQWEFNLIEDDKIVNAWGMPGGKAAAYTGILPFSRLHEKEADRIGLMLMARTGYDPRVAVPFWERMNQKEAARSPEFMSIHPAPLTRIANIESYISEAIPYYQKSLK